MAKAPQLVVLLGLAIILAMAIYPPWSFVEDNKARPMGYAPLWNPPVEHQENNANVFGVKMQLGVQHRKANAIDLWRLAGQVAIAYSVTTGVFFLLRKART